MSMDSEHYGIDSSRGQMAPMEETGPMPAAGGQTAAPLRERKRGRPSFFSTKGRVREKDVLYLVEQLSIMFETGLNLMVALDCMAVQARNPALREIVEDMRESIREGSSLWLAMSNNAHVFSPICINMVRAGEIAGCMDEMLRRLAEYLEREIDISSRVKSAVSYPIIMLVMAGCVIAFLIVYVFPKFLPLFAGNEELLPGPTRLFLWLGTTCQADWPYILAGLAVLVAGLVVLLRQDSVKRTLDRFWLKIPLLGDVVSKVSLSRSFHTLAVLLHGGIPILEALTVARDVAGNHVFRQSWQDVSDELANGREFAEPLKKNRYIPASEVQMLSMGERSGHLSLVLSKISKHYEKEIDYSVKNLVKFVEPALIICMGFLVGLIVMSLILPIFKISQAIK